MVNPVLFFGYGNLSRGDDALGPLLLEHIEKTSLSSQLAILTDFQLQIEHALDLANRELVLFVDASVSCAGAYEFVEIQPALDKSYTTHAMSPAAVLAVYQSIKGQVPPPSFLLSIKGESFELGDGLSADAQNHLQQASQFADQLLERTSLNQWRKLASTGRESLGKHPIDHLKSHA
ncbi:MAG: hydrogenase maturation protease [Methylococcaceae bacterium]|nr:hydrogenase maturation protease [Methylococcaceae bacterium]